MMMETTSDQPWAFGIEPSDSIESSNLLSQQSNGAEQEELPFKCKISGTETLDKGYMEYGCSHYRRRCQIRAPCCDEVFDCHHCHNEAKNDLQVHQKLRHDVPRHEVEKVICSLCETEQEVQQICVTCGVCMGRYFCGICKLFDDDISKGQYHCSGCGICRIGGEENFFHCSKCSQFSFLVSLLHFQSFMLNLVLSLEIDCVAAYLGCYLGCCYSTVIRNSHSCVEGAMHHDCPVCFEYLFESRNDVIVMPCGHTIHRACLEEMQQHSQHACPLCSKSVCDLSKAWEKLDMEIAETPMPESLRNVKVWILCNDCGKSAEVPFHIVAHKCPSCKSYNTRRT